MRQVLVYPGEDGYWVAECPSLPGCISQGKSKEEAIMNIKEAIRAYVAALEQDNLPVPEERFEALLIAVCAGYPGFRTESVSGRWRRPASPSGGKKEAT
jgi:predicted RNase H-like HicB family nuclease